MEDTTMLDGSQPLFAGLTFTIIPISIPKEHMDQLAADIAANGGALQPFKDPPGRIDKLGSLTHIIATTSDFPDYPQALEQFVHVVKPSWVDACLNAYKVKNPRPYSPDPALFLSECLICIGDLPEGDIEAIEGGTLAMGGQIVSKLNKQVSHIIVVAESDELYRVATAKNLRVKKVLPHWFDDCLKVGRRISEGPYLLPDPEILKNPAAMPAAPRASKQIAGAADPEPTDKPYHLTPPEQAEPVQAIKAFNGKKIMLGDDLSLRSELKKVIIELIRSGGGHITSNVGEADIYVCNYRSGPDYVQASQAKKDVGNLSWLYYMIAHNTWTNPMRRLLHYPRPREGIPGFTDYKISISGYAGEARIYLENLVKAAGAQFTKAFKQENTHLIAAHTQSEKCEAAKEWGVHVVNHLWLEESYAKCKVQTLTNSRYVYFPPSTNLGEVLGHTEVDRAAVEKIYFSKNPQPAPARKGQNNANISKVVEKTKQSRTKPDISTPVARRTDEKENFTPGTTGSRGAKDRAMSKLHDSATDIAQFEKEMKRKGGVVHGGRREKDSEAVDKSKKSRESIASKRSIDEVEMDELSTVKNKKSKKEKLAPMKYRMLVSKCDRWVDDQDKESREKGILRGLGIYISEDTKKVDLLCAPKIVRTKKFVSAIACGPTVVSTQYLDDALKSRKLPPPEKYLLHDKDFERSHGFRLDESIERAKQNQKRLLKDWTIFCTDNVSGGFDTYKEIIAANGGKCQKFAGRTTNITAAKRSVSASNEVSQNQEEDEGDVLYLISDLRPADSKHWPSFRELAAKHDMIPRIVTTEWLLFVAMAQYIHWDPKWELKEAMVPTKK